MSEIKCGSTSIAQHIDLWSEKDIMMNKINMSLLEHCQKIRNLMNIINDKNSEYFSEYDWNCFINCIVNIEDSQEAILYYIQADFPNTCGGKYIFIYGLFQAFIIQRDAVRQIMKLFHFDESFMPGNDGFLTYNCEMRNTIVGHPTMRRDMSFAGIIRSSIRKTEIRFVKDTKVEGYSESIDILKCIEEQNKSIIYYLWLITNEMDKIIDEIANS